MQMRDVPGFLGLVVGQDGSVWSRRVLGTKEVGRVGDLKKLVTYRRPYGARYVVVCFRPLPRHKVVCLYVHRLVLEAFVGPCPEGSVACHYDGNTANNSVENLRWDTQEANLGDKRRHGTHGAKLTAQEVLEIRELRLKGATYPELSKRFGVHQSTLIKIVYGRTWAWLKPIGV